MKIVESVEKRFGVDCRVEWLGKGAQGSIKVDSSVGSQSPHCRSLDKRKKKESIIFRGTCTTFARKHNNGSWRGNLACLDVYRCARFQQWNATLVARYAHFLGVHRPARNTRIQSQMLEAFAYTGEEGGRGGGVHSYTWAPPPLYTSFTERTYVRLCTYMFGVLTIPGPENLQGSIALPPDCARTSLTDTASEGRTLFLFSSLAGFSLRTAPSGNIGEYYFEKYASRLVLQDSRLASRVAN